MKGLIIYLVFVVVGAGVAGIIGYFVEKQTSSGVSLLVFLVLFFANFVISWIAAVLVMDGSLKNILAAKDQLEAEKKGRESMK